MNLENNKWTDQYVAVPEKTCDTETKTELSPTLLTNK